MRQTTMTLRKLLKNNANIAGWEKVNGFWIPSANETGFTLFDTSTPYPLFWDGTYSIGGVAVKPMYNDSEVLDTTYRAKLNDKITNHYLNYRIGAETPDLFKHYFNTLLNEIMPTYNNKYRILWQYFAYKLPYGYFEHEDISGGQRTTYDSTDTMTKGDIKNYDKSGSITGQNVNDDSTAQGYNFDTPQNITDLNINSPSHMSSADANKTHDGQHYTQSGHVTLDNNGNPVIDNNSETYKTTYGNDTTARTGSDSTAFENRFNEKYGYTSNDLKMISDFSNELANIDLEIIKALRDCFSYVY